MSLPKCQSCWGTIQPDEERKTVVTNGLPLIYHVDGEICELLIAAENDFQNDPPILLPRIPVPWQHPNPKERAA